jgi:hypothetical protein
LNAVPHWWRIVIIAGLVVASNDVALRAQVVSGNLVGTVTDAHGGVVADAAIEAIQTATGIKSAVRSNASGDYRFTDLPAGDYSLNVIAAGFKPAAVKSAAVDVSRTATIDVTLQVGPISSSVDVIDAAASIDTTTANIGTTFNARELDVPVTSIGPGVLNLSLLAAGVASNGGLQLGTGPSVGGMRPRSNNFQVDGADNNNRANTGALVAVPNDATAELTMLQNSFDAQFGHGSGGQFNVTVRTGTNDLHGSLYEYLQNRHLNALDQLFASAGTRTKPRFDSNRFGGNAGGPVRRNKLFYFADLEYSPTGQASSPGGILTPTTAGYATLTGLPGLSATNLSVLKQYAAPAPVALADKSQYPVVAGIAIPVGILPVVAPSYNNVYNAVASGDYFASATNQLHLRYVLNHSSQIDNAAILPVFFQPITVGNNLAAITENHIFSPSLIGEFRIAYTRFVNDTSVGNYKFPGLDAFPNIQIADLGGLQIGPDPFAPQFVASNTYQAAANFTWIRGQHTVKAGFEAQQAIAPTRFSDNVRGDYEYGSLNVFLQDITPDQVAQRTIGNPTYYGTQHMLAGYVNDSIRLTKGLTASLGVRYEHFSVPYGETRQSLNAIASVPGVLVFNAPKAQYLNFAPRVGLAWSPGTAGKTSVRSGFGLAYDPLYDNIGINSQPPEFAVTVKETSMAIRGFLANGGIVPASGSGPLTAAMARASTSSYIPNQELPYALQWNIGAQHVFAKDFSVELRYLGTKGVHLDMQTRPTTSSPVTPAHSLPTYLQAPSQATLNAFPLTFDELNDEPTILPQYAAAGFTNGGLVEYAPRGNSTYHGLATEITKRYSAHLQFRAAWTWSHLIDDSTADFFTTLLTPRRPQNSQNLTAERASSALDHRHRVTFAAVYELPSASQSGRFMKQLTSGWSVAPMYIFESPEYVTALSQTDSNLNGDFFSDRVIVNPSGASGKGSDVTPLTNSAGETVAYLADNPNVRYIVAGPGAYANGGRNTLAGRPINNVDLNILKTVHAGERMRMQLSAQFFNALNHPQFVPGFTNRADNPPVPNNSGNVFNYLTPGSAIFNNPEAIYSSNPRGIQIALKLQF